MRETQFLLLDVVFKGPTDWTLKACLHEGKLGASVIYCQPGYPARRVDTQPSFTCNSPNRDSEWAAWAIFGGAAKHNKQNGQPRKLFSILFQLPARARACPLPETRLLRIDLFRLTVILFGR